MIILKNSDNIPLMEIKNFSVSFNSDDKKSKNSIINVVDNLSLEINKGEILAIIGSSGSGKSILAHGILNILPANANIKGTIFYKGKKMDSKTQNKLRGNNIAFIPQSVDSLDPLMRIKNQVLGTNNDIKINDRLNKIFQTLDLDLTIGKLFPFQLSGGMARRILFSTAIINDAELIIADEPTPGMSVEQAISSLSILKNLTREGKTVVLITHDIDLAVQFSDRVAIFNSGTIVEEANSSDFISTPSKLRHPYTLALWNALPQNNFSFEIKNINHKITTMSNCFFSEYCPIKNKLCEENEPTVRKLRNGIVRCINAT